MVMYCGCRRTPSTGKVDGVKEKIMLCSSIRNGGLFKYGAYMDEPEKTT